jgi:hypothetical protein
MVSQGSRCKYSDSKTFQFILFSTSIFLIFIPSILHAQIGDPGCDPDDPYCPIDGGVGLMIAAGVAYGIKRIKKQFQ